MNIIASDIFQETAILIIFRKVKSFDYNPDGGVVFGRHVVEHGRIVIIHLYFLLVDDNFIHIEEFRKEEFYRSDIVDSRLEIAGERHRGSNVGR